MQPTFFINHGGGPCFFLEPGPMREAWRALEEHLRALVGSLAERPRAVLVVSGHWETDVPTVNAAAAPDLLYDYGGFPEHTYQLAWPAPGEPKLASRVRDLLDASGIENRAEARRGWDHGVFVPLKVMLPAADVPTVQLSMQRGLDPAGHIAIGRALRQLRGEGVLIVGSGQSYHNMRGFGGAGPDRNADLFDAWLRDAMSDPEIREEALVRWSEAPGARDAHPHEDHLLPLMVAVGAAPGDPATIDFHGRVLGKPISGFRFG